MAFATNGDVVVKGAAVWPSTIVVWRYRCVPACPSTIVCGYESVASSGVAWKETGVVWRDARGVACREPAGDCGRQERSEHPSDTYAGELHVPSVDDAKM